MAQEVAPKDFGLSCAANLSPTSINFTKASLSGYRERCLAQAMKSLWNSRCSWVPCNQCWDGHFVRVLCGEGRHQRDTWHCWECRGATSVSRLFQRWYFTASMKTALGYCSSLYDGTLCADTTSRRDFISPITYYLHITMWKFSRVCWLILAACIRCCLLSGTSKNVLIFCLLQHR